MAKLLYQHRRNLKINGSVLSSIWNPSFRFILPHYILQGSLCTSFSCFSDHLLLKLFFLRFSNNLHCVVVSEHSPLHRPTSSLIPYDLYSCDNLFSRVNSYSHCFKYIFCTNNSVPKFESGICFFLLQHNLICYAVTHKRLKLI